jgi:hypothetical protein
MVLAEGHIHIVNVNMPLWVTVAFGIVTVLAVVIVAWIIVRAARNAPK